MDSIELSVLSRPKCPAIGIPWHSLRIGALNSASSGTVVKSDIIEKFQFSIFTLKEHILTLKLSFTFLM